MGSPRNIDIPLWRKINEEQTLCKYLFKMNLQIMTNTDVTYPYVRVQYSKFNVSLVH